MSDKGRTTKTVQKKVVISVIIILAIIFVYQTGSMTDAKALTRYDNCTTRVANKKKAHCLFRMLEIAMIRSSRAPNKRRKTRLQK